MLTLSVTAWEEDEKIISRESADRSVEELDIFHNVALEFKRHKLAACSDRSSAHLHLKLGYIAGPTGDSRSAFLPPAGFIRGEDDSHSGEGKGDREQERDQEEAKSYCTCVQSQLVEGTARKHLKDGKKCHAGAKCPLI